MATITTFPFITHPARRRCTSCIGRAANCATTLRVRQPSGSARMSAAISEVPVDDREQPARDDPHRRSPAGAPGTVTYRFVDPALAATHIDFSIHLRTGSWAETPLEKVGSAIHGATRLPR